MNKELLIQLTNNLYRLTLLFPKKEPLRYKMRELANDILAKPKEKDFEVLDSFFEVALVQNWVSPSDILAIKKEYDILREELKKSKLEKKKDNPVAIEVYPEAIPTLGGSRAFASLPPLPHYNSDTEQSEVKKSTKFSLPRQEKILAFLRENSRAQVWQIKQILPEVTKRTLRRDFEHMLEQGVIERGGERNNTFYQIKNLQS